MKWQLKFIITPGILLISFSSFSTQTIYGLQNINQHKLSSSGNFYIQMGSYKNKSNALGVKLSLQNKTNHPVLLKEKSGYYIILVGPLHSAKAVRTTAQEISSTPFSIPVPPKAKNKNIVSLAKQKSIRNTKDEKLARQAPAINVYKERAPSPGRWFVGLGLGWMFPFGTDATSFISSGMPGFPDDKYKGEGSKSAPQYSFLAGYQWRRDAQWFPAYSLNLHYTYTSSTQINGVIFVNNLPDSKNFTYKYDISQHVPMAKFKMDLYRWQQFMPYISIGAGAVFNEVHNYSDSPIPGATLMHRRYGFNSATKTQFAGSIGAGLDYLLTNQGQISLGYELASYGRVRTGNGQGILSSYYLGNDLYSNTIVLQGTYFFDWS